MSMPQPAAITPGTGEAVPPPASSDAVAVVTVNWNGWKLTLDCLDALRRSEGADWRFIIVDNGSTDESLAHLQGLGDDVTLIVAGVNGGWTGGNNLGIRAAMAAGYRNILLLNNDAFVEPDTIARLVTAKAGGDGRSIFGPVHLTPDGVVYDFVNAYVDAVTGLPDWRGVEPDGIAALPDLIETATIKGAGILVDARHFQDLGLFDDTFFLNFDESDWCFRARAAGYRLLMVKDARIRHIGSATIGGASSPLQAYFLVRNALLFAERHSNVGQRLRLLRRLSWDARQLPRKGGAGAGWIWGFLFSPSPADRAFRLGVRDYLLRRFGDCPPVVRELNRRAN